MKAIVQDRTGGPEVLAPYEIAEPPLRASDVLIRVHTCGVCYHDVVVRNGIYRKRVRIPLVPGHEVSGVVERVGAEVRRLNIGDRVCTVQRRSVCGHCRECRAGSEVSCEHLEFMGDADLNGGYAELVAVAQNCVAAVPDGLSLEEASIVACAVGTQLNAIRDVGNVRLGETVLVTGANGGQGAHGVQIARACGAHVIGIASSEEKATRVRDLGAHDVVVVPHGHDFSPAVRALTGGRGVNVVIDNVGTAVFDQVRRSLARHGRWVLVGALDGSKAGFNNAQMFTNDIYLLSAVSCKLSQLEDALELVRRGLVRPQITHRLPLEAAAEAHTMLERASPAGRIVLSIGERASA